MKSGQFKTIMPNKKVNTVLFEEATTSTAKDPVNEEETPLAKSINKIRAIALVKEQEEKEKAKEESKKEAKKALAQHNTHLVVKQESSKYEIGKIIMQEVLPMWDDFNRGAPNPVIRSSLFSVQTSEAREFVKKQTIYSTSNHQISYTGEQLQQEDLSVWLCIIHMARIHSIESAIYFTTYQLIKDLGWKMHSDTYDRVKLILSRLKVTGVTIAAGVEKNYEGSLVQEIARSEFNGQTYWMVQLNPRITGIFMTDTTTLLEWEVRKEIGKKATVALWLHAYYSSHKVPYAISIRKLHELCGSANRLTGFRVNLNNALQKLITVGFLETYHIDKDIVTVVKSKRGSMKLVNS